ncbi:MAG: hypothetical protein DRQ49_17495 [Gammaproteobacteria bacterium]|nr:MAG: hypothetical protein DRQ49_17495 [Gammaproteobacteria bacterium]
MPDVWTIVKENSSLPSGDFWEHLNNQQGGTETFLTLSDGLEVEMTEACFDVELQAAEVEVEVQENYDVEVELTEYIVEVCV